MNKSPTVLNYAKPTRQASVWREAEPWLAMVPNAVLGVIGGGARFGWWVDREGVPAGLFAVAAALTLTVTVIAALGVVAAYIDGPTTRSRQRVALWAFMVSILNCAIFIGVVALAVVWR